MTLHSKLAILVISDMPHKEREEIQDSNTVQQLLNHPLALGLQVMLTFILEDNEMMGLHEHYL